MTHIPDELRSKVALRAERKCEYCRLPDRLQSGGFEMDHIVPASIGGATTAENLAYACPHCNDHKWAHVDGIDAQTGTVTRLFHPRIDEWNTHFVWSDRVTLEIVGRTPVGRATIARLQLNHAELVAIRRELARLGQFSV